MQLTTVGRDLSRFPPVSLRARSQSMPMEASGYERRGSMPAQQFGHHALRHYATGRGSGSTSPSMGGVRAQPAHTLPCCAACVCRLLPLLATTHGLQITHRVKRLAVSSVWFVVRL